MPYGKYHVPGAEKKCRKLMTPTAEFSPQVQHWYERIYVYMYLLKHKKGTKKYPNAANTKIMTRRKGIKKPSELTIEEIKDGRDTAKSEPRTSGNKPKDSGKPISRIA